MGRKIGCLAAVIIVLVGLIVVVAITLASGGGIGHEPEVGHTPPPGGVAYMPVSFHA
jgi:hypothetical protein